MSLLIVAKRSKWERDLEHYGSREKALQIYAIQNQTADRILESHARQKEALQLLRAGLPQATFYSRQELAQKGTAGFFCVASLGGDNHFVHVSRSAQSLLAGINSDPMTSSGNLLYFHAKAFLEVGSSLCEGKIPAACSVEQWPCLTGRIVHPDGSEATLPRAVSEISIRSAFTEHVARALIRLPGETGLHEQKSSGLLLATGTGSTGWFQSAGGTPFPRTQKAFCYLLREPYALQDFTPTGRIEEGEELEIISEMDGVVNVDAEKHLCFPFPPASRAFFVLDNVPLRVLRPA